MYTSHFLCLFYFHLILPSVSPSSPLFHASSSSLLLVSSLTFVVLFTLSSYLPTSLSCNKSQRSMCCSEMSTARPLLIGKKRAFQTLDTITASIAFHCSLSPVYSGNTRTNKRGCNLYSLSRLSIYLKLASKQTRQRECICVSARETLGETWGTENELRCHETVPFASMLLLLRLLYVYLAPVFTFICASVSTLHPFILFSLFFSPPSNQVNN